VQLARQFPQTRVSVLIESPEQAASWRETGIGIFIDVNSGMNRTGISPERIAEIVTLAKQLGNDFRGLHFYDGQISAYPIAERERQAYMGYDRLMTLLEALEGTAVRVREVITSGTPAAPFGYSYRRFQQTGFVHRISPGTVVYNDTTSLEQLPAYGFRPAAVVLSTVISRPLPDHVTCDAGHKSVSADAGVPTCLVLGHAELEPLKPSEEHLPLRVSSGHRAPEIGDKLYLLPRHVCPSVNNFDDALFIRDQTVSGVERVSARGHENPLAAVKDPVAAAG
jgi:D-serine deaminase-like pyridoxal phosphate-dependent protein